MKLAYKDSNHFNIELETYHTMMCFSSSCRESLAFLLHIVFGGGGFRD